MSMSRGQRKFMIAAGLVVVLVLCAGALLPRLRSSNCGGNSAALASCKGYITVLRIWGADHDGQTFHYDQADHETRQVLGDLPGASWIRSARLLARLDGVRIDSVAEKRIILVCDQPYDNVPERLFGKAPMAHAVAYSTGETGLISPDEFALLDVSGFVDLQAQPTKVEPDGAANGSQPIRSETNSTSSGAGSRR